MKKAGTVYLTHLQQLMINIWNEDPISEEWNLGVIYPIHKKGDISVSYTHLDVYKRQALNCLEIS